MRSIWQLASGILRPSNRQRTGSCRQGTGPCRQGTESKPPTRRIKSQHSKLNRRRARPQARSDHRRARPIPAGQTHPPASRTYTGNAPNASHQRTRTSQRHAQHKPSTSSTQGEDVPNPTISKLSIRPNMTHESWRQGWTRNENEMGSNGQAMPNAATTIEYAI